MTYELALEINQTKSHSDSREQTSCIFLYNFLHLSPSNDTYVVITATTYPTCLPTSSQGYSFSLTGYVTV